MFGYAGKTFGGMSVALTKPAQHSVHPTGGSRRVFRQFAWLGVGSVKIVLSHPTHQRVTHTVGQNSLEHGETTMRKDKELSASNNSTQRDRKATNTPKPKTSDRL